MSRLYAWSIVAVVLVLTGCQTGPLKDVSLPRPFQSKAEQALSDGIKEYEDGDYKDAQASLRSALDHGLTSKVDQVKAHKYLAFIHCASNREKQCREEFRKTLDIDPAFDLTPAESGHPIWGPVFRSVKRGGR